MEMSKKKEKKINCLVYLSVDADERSVETKEKKQLKYIKEYAAAHNINIVGIYHRDVLGRYDIERHFKGMLHQLKNHEADGILLANMAAISTGIPDAYYKTGLVIASGGQMITVDEGSLSMNIKGLGGIGL